MSSLQKLFVSPANSVSCRSCGKKVSIRWRHALALLLPAAIGLATMKILGLEPVQILIFGLILIVIAGLAQVLFIPLSRERF
jgi:hypothetical protein